MKKSSFISFTLWSVLFLLFSLTACIDQYNGLSKTEMQRIADTCISSFQKHYVYPEIVPEMGRFVKANIEEGKYDDVENLEELTKRIRKDFRQVSNDRHIWIDVMKNLPVKNSDVSDEEKIRELQITNFGFVEFKLLEGNVACLRLDGFKDLKYARDTAIFFMNKLSRSDAIIIDLRNNHGGNSNMVHFLSSYFFDQKVQLNSLYFREADSLATAWTDPDVPGEKLINQKIYILTGNNTTSASEAFTCTMKNYKRATIVGEHTRGAGHWNETFKYSEMDIFLEIPVARPINPVTGKGWELTGILPDIEIAEDRAFEKAYELALTEK